MLARENAQVIVADINMAASMDTIKSLKQVNVKFCNTPYMTLLVKSYIAVEKFMNQDLKICLKTWKHGQFLMFEC